MPGCQLLLAVTTMAGPSPPASSASASARACGQHFLLHRLPLLVQPVERLGDGAGLDRIVGGQQPAAKRGVADAPAGIDARADQEGEVKGADRLADARDPRQRRQPFILLLATPLQALDHEGAVDAGQRHHVADGGQRHQVEQRQADPAVLHRQAAAQDLRRLHQGEEDDAGGAKMALAGKVVLAVGVDDRGRRRQRTADLMVVEHHDIGAGRLRRVDGNGAVGAAIDCDDQRRAARDEFAHGFRIGAVALENTVRNVDLRRHAEMRRETA